ncbi:MAG: ABC transporter permease [Bdellovibrionales bacterium]|nr:ABC transporter permease [Bdellovibrionales bacterium]
MLNLKSDIRNTFLTWKRNPIGFTSIVLVMSFSLTILISIFNVSLNLEKILVSWGNSNEVTVYVNDDVTKSQVSVLESALEDFDRVQETEFFSKKKAAQEFKKEMSSYAADFASEDEIEAAVPASFRLKVKESTNVPDLERLSKKIRKLEGVEDVSYGQQWVQQYRSVVRGAQRSGFAINLAILLSAIFVIGNAIRISISQRSEEVEILELVGATPKMIRKPFVVEGAILGFISGSLAIVSSYGVLLAQRYLANDLFDFWQLSAALRFLSLPQVLALLIGSIVVGALGSYLCLASLKFSGGGAN